MKLIQTIFLTIAFHATAQAGNAISFQCSGNQAGEPISVVGTWVPNYSLSQLSIHFEGQNNTYQTTILKPYAPRNATYMGFNRFQIGGDGWSMTSVLMPQAFPTKQQFVAYYYDQGEAGQGTIPLKCVREN